MLVQARKGSADCCDEPGLGLGDKGGVGPPWTVRRYLSPHSPGWKSRAGNLRGIERKGSSRQMSSCILYPADRGELLKVFKQEGCDKSTSYKESVSGQGTSWKKLRCFRLDGRGGSALQEAVVDVQAGDLGAVKSAEGEEKQVERGTC